MDPDIAWQDLVAASVLGTERRAFVPPTTTGPLGDLLGGLGGRDPEKALLGTAGGAALFRRAGRRAISDPSDATEPAESDDRPRCSVASAGHISQMLSGTHADVLAEWLEALVSAGKRPPEECLPELLDLGRSKADLRPAIIAAVGPLGAWLARQNPDWAYAAGMGADATIVEDDAAIEALWQTGTVEQRTSLLGRLRESRPDRARDLVASTWSTDGPEIRAKFLGQFAAGLTMANEPFLEAALDDRRKEVRTAAADLLVRLPGSGLVRRMIERVAPRLRLSDHPPLEVNEAVSRLLAGEPGEETSRGLVDLIEGKMELPRPAGYEPGAVFLEVTLPKECDKAMIRDGIEPKSSRHNLGEKAWWLHQMIARVPPSTWSRAWRRTPAELAQAVVLRKGNDAIYSALIEAAILHDDPAWIEALLPYRGQAGKTFNIFAAFDSLRPEITLSLIQTGDAEVRIRFEGNPLTEEQMNLLHRTTGPWGDDLSRLVLMRLARNLDDKNHLNYALGGLLQQAARCIPPALVLASPPGRTAGDSKIHAYLLQEIDRHLEAFHALIQFRHDMIQELRR